MQEILTDLTQWIQMLHPSWIVLIVSLIAYLENVVPPIPGDLVIVFAGFMASDGIIRIAPVYIGSSVASVVGFMSMYYVGVYLRGKSVQLNDPKSFWRKILNPKHLKKSRKWMSRWGQWVIVGNRFLAGTRSVIAITAGYSRTHLLVTSISSLVSSLLWNGILLFAGFLIHENWLLIGRYLSIYSRIILVLLALVLIAVVFIRRRRRAATKIGAVGES